MNAELAYFIDNPLEIFAAVTALLCVWLAIRVHVLNWPVAIISSILYWMIFNKAGYYSDSLLQIVFIILQIYGWVQWYAPLKSSESIQKATTNWTIKAVVVAILFWILWYYVLLNWKPHASLPLLDSGTTAFSLLAIYMQAKKYLQNWWFWLLVDVVYIPMYWHKQLYITAFIYSLYLIMAMEGYRQWKNSMKPGATK